MSGSDQPGVQAAVERDRLALTVQYGEIHFDLLLRACQEVVVLDDVSRDD